MAFTRGQSVVVESISPNPSRPEYKYVIYSTYLQKRFQLSDDDVFPVAETEAPTSAPPRPTASPQAPPPPQPVAQEKAGGFWNARNLAALIILIALIPAGIYAVPKVTHWLNSPADQGTPSVVPSGNPSAVVPASGTITKSKYDQLQSGMSYEEVVNIVGSPGVKGLETGSPGQPGWSVQYIWYGDQPGSQASCTFLEGKLYQKFSAGEL